MDTTPIAQLGNRLHDELTAIADPAERARAATEVLQALADIPAKIADIRQDAVIELRKTLKLREIAEELGVGTARVDQILKAKRHAAD